MVDRELVEKAMNPFEKAMNPFEKVMDPFEKVMNPFEKAMKNDNEVDWSDYLDNLTDLFDESDLPPEKIQKLLEKSRTNQKSDEWLRMRHNYITGSIVSDACGIKGPAARRNLLLEKVSFGEYRNFFGSAATDWGERFEPVANGIYCYRNKCKVYDFGLIPHQEHEFLAASTDGVTEHLINLEIKCPISREINGKVPKHYWHQVQHQLEVLDIDMSHFLECRFYTYQDLENFLHDFNYPREHQEKGVLIEIVRDTGKEYICSPIELHLDSDQLVEWWERTSEKLADTVYNTYFWVLEQYSCQEIKRDPDWFKTMKPIMDDFWREVEYYREVGVDKLLIEIEKNSKPRKPRVKKELEPQAGSCLLD